MAISDRLNKLTTDITNAYTSIENKGGTIPSDKNTDNLHTAIDSIEVIEQATAEGENISLTNTKAMPYSDYVVEGKSEQEGTPSPSIPSEIHSVADDVNLFDIGTINDYKNYEDRADKVNWLTIENNKMICVVQDYGETLAYNNNFYFKPNTTYSFSLVSSSNETRFLIKLRNLQDTDWLTDSDTSIAGWTYNLYYKGWFVTNAQQKTVNIPNCLFGVLGFGFNSTTETTGTTQTISNIKIQKGSTATPYSPYNQGTVTIKQRGKNLWNNSNVTSTTIMTPNSNGGFKIQKVGNERISEEYSINIPANTNIAISSILKDYTTSNGAIYCQWIATDNTTIWTPNIYEGTTTTSFNKDIKGIKFYLQQTVNDGDYVEIEKLQIEKGSTATTYEPYQANDFTFQTEPLRSLPNGVKDTIEADGIHRRVGRIVLDGTESGGKSGYSNDTYSVFYTNDYNNVLPTNPLLISNYFINDNEIGTSSSITKEAIGYRDFNYGIRISILKSKADTFADFQAWLSTHNTEVLYPLAEEIIEPFTQNQATTMLDIIKTGSYEGTTNIYTDEDVKPTIGVDYYKKA